MSYEKKECTTCQLANFLNTLIEINRNKMKEDFLKEFGPIKNLKGVKSLSIKLSAN